MLTPWSATVFVTTRKGTLLQQKKELELHCDIKSGDRLLFFSTLGWVSFLGYRSVIFFAFVATFVFCNSSISPLLLSSFSALGGFVLRE